MDLGKLLLFFCVLYLVDTHLDLWWKDFWINMGNKMIFFCKTSLKHKGWLCCEMQPHILRHELMFTTYIYIYNFITLFIFWHNDTHPTQLQCTKFQENTIIQLSFTHVTNHNFHKTSFTQRVEHWERLEVLRFGNWKWKT